MAIIVRLFFYPLKPSLICTERNPGWKPSSTTARQPCAHQKSKSLTPEELKALDGLLHAAQPYCPELNVTLLFPKHRLPLPLDGDTPEERMESLLTKSEEVFAVFYPDSPFDITYSFARRFWQMIFTDFPMSQLAKMLRKLRK